MAWGAFTVGAFAFASPSCRSFAFGSFAFRSFPWRSVAFLSFTFASLSFLLFGRRSFAVTATFFGGLCGGWSCEGQSQQQFDRLNRLHGNAPDSGVVEKTAKV